ncbi:MAG: ACP S-malonyltransferase [Ignavibacteriales bacterium]|nr:ACP S-malonyltransferase [Ignavibacteriales bacterium]
MVAFVFPGQGSQYVGMGKDLHEKSADARSLFEAADKILGFSLSRLCFDGPDEELRQTKNTQPAIFLHSVVLTKLYRGPLAAMAAGHSLGEYSALVYAGALSFEDGLKLVRLRGELMHRAGTEQPGTMAAIVGLDPKTIDEVCGAATKEGVVQPANFNSPGQVVISGSTAGVRRAMEMAKGRGAKLVKELQVSGAFHSPLMESAKAGLKKALEATKICDSSIPVYANVTAKSVLRGEEIRELLVLQLTSPVRWEESVVNMARDGATTFVEVGPSKVLQGLVRRIDGKAEIKGMEKITDLSA